MKKNNRGILLAIVFFVAGGGAWAESLVPTTTLDGWYVECQDGWRVGADTECDGPSRGRLALGDNGLRFTWDLGWSDWVQILYARAVPVDLSQTAGLTVRLRGDTPVQTQVMFMLVDRQDVFYGQPLVEPSHGLERASRWELQAFLPRASFRYLFNLRGQPPSELDESSIDRFFLSMVRPSSGTLVGGGGGGQLWVQSISSEPVGLTRLSVWREDPLDAESWTLPRTPLVQRERVSPWIMECDAGVREKNTPAGATKGGVLVPNTEGSVTFDWNTSRAEWVQAARDLPLPLDLRNADRFFVDLRLTGGLATPNVLYLMVADEGGVYAGYEAGLRRLSSEGYDDYRLHLSLARDRLWFHFDQRATRQEIDWSRIKRIFVGVKRAVGNTEGGQGRITVDDFTVHLSPAAKGGAVVRREQWTYAFAHEWNSVVLSAGAKADLAKVAEHLRWQPGRTLLITSLADIRETNADALAHERAAHVVETLTREHHVDPSRLKVETPPPHRPFAGERLPRTVLRLIGSVHQ